MRGTSSSMPLVTGTNSKNPAAPSRVPRVDHAPSLCPNPWTSTTGSVVQVARVESGRAGGTNRVRYRPIAVPTAHASRPTPKTASVVERTPRPMAVAYPAGPDSQRLTGSAAHRTVLSHLGEDQLLAMRGPQRPAHRDRHGRSGDEE